MKWFKLVAAATMIAFLVGCTKEMKADTPEGALQKYVTAAFSARSTDDRQKLVNLSTGEALAFIQSMSDETFKKHFIDSNFDFVSLKAKDLRQENSGDVSLVYELTYREGKGESKVEHTNKKIAYLTLDAAAGEWKIKATKNLKSFVERKEDLVVTPETTDNSAPEQEGATEKK
jgi:hypothetical protein